MGCATQGRDTCTRSGTVSQQPHYPPHQYYSLTGGQGPVALHKEASTPQLTHFSFREHLRSRPELITTAHSAVVGTCLVA